MWATNVDVCYWGIKFMGTAYVIGKLWVLLFLFARGRIVKPFSHSRTLLETCTLTVTVFGVPVFVAVVFAFVHGEIVSMSADHASISSACVILAKYQLPLVMLCLDVGLATAYLAMFVATLRAADEARARFNILVPPTRGSLSIIPVQHHNVVVMESPSPSSPPSGFTLPSMSSQTCPRLAPLTPRTQLLPLLQRGAVAEGVADPMSPPLVPNINHNNMRRQINHTSPLGFTPRLETTVEQTSEDPSSCHHQDQAPPISPKIDTFVTQICTFTKVVISAPDLQLKMTSTIDVPPPAAPSSSFLSSSSAEMHSFRGVRLSDRRNALTAHLQPRLVIPVLSLPQSPPAATTPRHSQQMRLSLASSPTNARSSARLSGQLQDRPLTTRAEHDIYGRLIRKHTVLGSIAILVSMVSMILLFSQSFSEILGPIVPSCGLTELLVNLLVLELMTRQRARSTPTSSASPNARVADLSTLANNQVPSTPSFRGGGGARTSSSILVPAWSSVVPHVASSRAVSSSPNAIAISP